jgi:predicted CopG family antitoxin
MLEKVNSIRQKCEILDCVFQIIARTVKYTACVCNIMGHKTITISDEAYRALKRRKKEDESFTEVILREFSEGNAERILSIVTDPGFPDKELAENVRQASREHRQKFKVRV